MIARSVYTALLERCIQLETGTPIKPPVTRRYLSPALRARIQEQWAQGVSRRDIATLLGVPYSVVWYRTRGSL